jgi:hypothetical protein
MPYQNVREVLKKSTFFAQLALTIAINFGINFGLAWATYSNWGAKGHNYNDWPAVGVWKLNPEVNSCIAMDMMITSVFIAFFCTLLGTNGAIKDVKDKKCDVMASSVTATGWWRYTPVGYHNLCARSAASACYFTLLMGIPSLLVVWMAVQGGEMSGIAYTTFKGIWVCFYAIPVYIIVYFAAIDVRNFPEIEFEGLMRAGGLSPGGQEKDAPPPLVANIGHV